MTQTKNRTIAHILELFVKSLKEWEDLHIRFLGGQRFVYVIMYLFFMFFLGEGRMKPWVSSLS